MVLPQEIFLMFWFVTRSSKYVKSKIIHNQKYRACWKKWFFSVLQGGCIYVGIFHIIDRYSYFLKISLNLNQNPADFSLCRGSAGPQRRAWAMGSKEYKSFTLKFLKIENAQKMSFWSQNCQKWSIKIAKMSIVLPNILIFGVIYQPFELKIHAKVGLSRSKTIPKLFLNVKNTFEKSRKRLFRPLKW